MRMDVVLRYVGSVMLFIALFMLLSAVISYVSGCLLYTSPSPRD